MKKLQFLIFLQSVIIAVMLLAGCSTSTRFVADTRVDVQGNVVRTTRLESSGSAAFDRLTTHYLLLPGGEWTETTAEEPGLFEDSPPRRVLQHSYSVVRRFARGDDIAADFERRAAVAAGAARNEIAVRTRRLWFVDTFSYQETFGDIPTLESVTFALDRLFEMAVQIIAEEVAALDPALTIGQARGRLVAGFGPHLDAIGQAVQRHCVDEVDAATDCIAQVEQAEEMEFIVAMFEDDSFILDEIEALFPAPAGTAAGRWRELLHTEVMDDAEIRADRELTDSWLEEVEEDLFGVHGFALFESYPFELSVSLPGELVSTNAEAEASGDLRWAFDHDDFWMRDRTLHARTRIVHTRRILAASAALLLAGVVVVSVVRRRRRTRHGI